MQKHDHLPFYHGLSKMKKTLFLLLLGIALLLYTYNALLIAKVTFPWQKTALQQTDKNSRLTFEQLLVAAVPAKFEVKGRDPFTYAPTKAAPPPVKNVVKATPKVEKKEVAAPPIVITGIMWHPETPVAIIKVPGGSTKMVKAGQLIGETITIKKIDKHSVTVVFEGTTFTIDKK